MATATVLSLRVHPEARLRLRPAGLYNDDAAPSLRVPPAAPQRHHGGDRFLGGAQAVPAGLFRSTTWAQRCSRCVEEGGGPSLGFTPSITTGSQRAGHPAGSGLFLRAPPATHHYGSSERTAMTSVVVLSLRVFLQHHYGCRSITCRGTPCRCCPCGLLPQHRYGMSSRAMCAPRTGPSSRARPASHCGTLVRTTPAATVSAGHAPPHHCGSTAAWM